MSAGAGWSKAPLGSNTIKNMVETFAQYKARIESYVEGQDPIAIQKQTPSTLAHLVQGVPQELFTRERAPGEWSVREILAHLAEAEIVSTWRYRQMIETSGVAIAAFDQNVWTRLGDYGSIDASESLNFFRLLRDNNLRLFSRLRPEEWQCFGIHAERGRMTVKDLALQIAGHDLNHIAQVRQIVGAPS